MFIDVYSKATGRKHRVPEHYLTNPVLAKPFRKTPKTRAAETSSATPETDVVTATTDTTETPAARGQE
ncbi:hypothetical protein ABKW28_12800 [Nocardioides sp. 31GB23]|uniref:hypothetical protein n=1 Tax=Nocardioides sp. 31GB23 TaxID=3156065 RepID=UPI0032AFD38E